jgi:heme A synthase
MRNVLFVSLIFPLLIDIWFCWLELRRNRKGKGASSVPFLTLIVYFVLIGISNVNLWEKIILAVVCLFIHISLLFIIPILDSKIFPDKQN